MAQAERAGTAKLGISPNKSKSLRVAHWFDDRGWHRLADFIWQASRRQRAGDNRD